MDVSFLPQLDYLSSYYNESFASYKRHTNEYEKMLEWISDRFDAEITSKLLKKENEDGNVTLSVLGIGSGDGKLDVEMLIRLKKKFGTIECTVWWNHQLNESQAIKNLCRNERTPSTVSHSTGDKSHFRNSARSVSIVQISSSLSALCTAYIIYQNKNWITT